MKAHALTVGAFDENTWFLHDPTEREVVLVDPGDEPQRLLAELDALDAKLVAIWLTHAHIDHIGGIAGVKARWPGPEVFSHPLDAPMLLHAARVAASYGIPFETPPTPERALAEGQRLEFAGETFEVWHLPGHAPGHVAFIGAGHCFSGDLLFAGSIGRTDLPLCDPAAMEHSIARLGALPEETIVHPGHGPETTIGRERRTNPFLNGAARIARR